MITKSDGTNKIVNEGDTIKFEFHAQQNKQFDNQEFKIIYVVPNHYLEATLIPSGPTFQIKLPESQEDFIEIDWDSVEVVRKRLPELQIVKSKNTLEIIKRDGIRVIITVDDFINFKYKNGQQQNGFKIKKIDKYFIYCKAKSGWSEPTTQIRIPDLDRDNEITGDDSGIDWNSIEKVEAPPVFQPGRTPTNPIFPQTASERQEVTGDIARWGE
jgi:hypothetical protein